MKRKHLESALSEVDVFDDPKIELEQIPTSPHIASMMIFTAASMYGDIEGKMIGDFGCGPGILSVACSMMGATSVLSLDVDQDALDCAWVNLKKMEIENVDLVMMDVQSLNLKGRLDTVVMNPPFGTRNTGIDTAFVMKALEYADTVYSLHKTSTRDHFIRLAKTENLGFEVVAELKYDIPKTFSYHKEKSKDVFVDVLRFSRNNSANNEANGTVFKGV
jgi:predicted RNA methylase